MECDMDVRQLIARLMSVRTSEYLSENPPGLFPVPRLYPPAGQQEVAGLERRAGQLLESHYRDFLSFTDGLDGFYLTMPIFGCRDYEGESRVSAAIEFMEALHESETPVDVGLPEGVSLFPVSVNDDKSQGIFMLDVPGVLPERWWWIGEGSSSFFGTFSDVLGYAIDPRSYSPREYVD
jgi:hypothetical protein